MFKNYIKIAWRNLLKRKVFTFINVVGLAIGFGSSILIYLFLNYNLSFDNFHVNGDRIYRINTEQHRDDIEYDPSVPPAFANVFREEYDYSERVAKIAFQGGLLIDIDDNGYQKKLKQDVAYAEEDFFNIFSFPLIYGGTEVSLSEPNTAVLTEAMAIKMFGQSDVVGKTFVLEKDKTITITGVLKNFPRTSHFTDELFVSFENLIDIFEFAAGENWGGITSNLETYTLLKPNQNIANIETALLQLPKKHRPNSKTRHLYKLQNLSDIHFSPDYGGLDPNLLWIFGIVGLFLIVIAGINFINISSAQAFYRSKEIGIRKVLGSFKTHLFWQFLTETFVISLFALGLGLVFAALFLPMFNDLFRIQLELSDLLSVQFFSYILTILVVVSFLSGSYPGLLMSRIVPVLALKGKLSHNDTGSSSTRKFLVIAQFVISIVLIASTIIISKQIDYAVNSDLGFNKESIVMLPIPSDIEEENLYSLKNRMKQIAGVENVSGCLSSPGAAENNWGTGIRFHTKPEVEEFNIQAKLADEDYIETFGLELVAGRNFFKKDTLDEVLVNEKLAKKLGLDSSEEMLGKQIAVNGETIKATIVGVVKDFHDQNFTSDINPIFIAPYTNAYGEIAVKMNPLNRKQTLSKIDERWSETFDGYIFEYRFLDDRVAEQYEREQRYLSLSKVFSGLAILIGCLGLYGLILFFVGQRTKEIGIRKVLGSNVSSILALFSIDFLKLVLIAGLIATPVTWYFMNEWLQEYTYRTEIHWWYFAIAVLLIMLITMITISYQTLKVAFTSPVKSLRTE
ncbi:FtsX-like permease family protein [Maribacter algarum]|uniref:FtsX-like permease family protein n=1 Tax=Maribacter algarum (ex Zhang et al. 2020) TaxID=2578118 RepID=A0A5S3Q5T7_9FLAO|nr:ABC transporter permease [Maribacter algarum]TMM52131.1 FtsX-like permease family protein [Maribacter algarum]